MISGAIGFFIVAMQCQLGTNFSKFFDNQQFSIIIAFFYYFTFSGLVNSYDFDMEFLHFPGYHFFKPTFIYTCIVEFHSNVLRRNLQMMLEEDYRNNCCGCCVHSIFG